MKNLISFLAKANNLIVLASALFIFVIPGTKALTENIPETLVEKERNCFKFKSTGSIVCFETGQIKEISGIYYISDPELYDRCPSFGVYIKNIKTGKLECLTKNTLDKRLFQINNNY